MTRTLRVVAALVLLPFVAACRRAAADGSAPAGDRALIVAELERGPCYGRCPEYTLALFADGLVRFEGKRNVKATGVHTRDADLAGMQLLMLEYGAKLDALRDSVWTPGAATCTESMTDLPTAHMALRTKAARYRRFVVNYGCPNAPIVLKDFARALDSLALSPDWLIR